MDKQPLTILMPTEFFPPFDRGGSEWSTIYLAKRLLQKGHHPIIITPNYGAKSNQVWRGLKVSRFYIGKKLHHLHESVTPFWHTNPWWVIVSTLALLKSVHKFHPNVIHIQGKYFLPAVGIVKLLTRIPTVITLRDYQVLCNLGLCLWHKNHRCTVGEFFTSELKTYQRHYQVSYNYFRSTLGRLISIWLRLWLFTIDRTVCISKKQAQIFTANGINNTIIHNTTTFKTKTLFRHKHPALLFVGRLTPGKGAHLLVPLFFKINKQLPQYQLIVIGTGLLQSRLHQQAEKLNLKKNIIFIPHAPHQHVLKYCQQASLVIIPSLWPEPFGRIALEAIAMGTPAITSDRGGLPEIIQNRYGISVRPTVKNLFQATMEVLKNHRKFTSQIKKDQLQLRHQFTTQPVTDYLALYAQLIAGSVFKPRGKFH